MRQLRWPLALTRAGLLAEIVVRALWPLWTLLLTGLALVMVGLVAALPVELAWALGGLAALAALALLILGLRRIRIPSRDEAFRRLDATLKGQPLQALRDAPALGEGDPGTRALWEAHQARMAVRAREARPVEPDLRLSSRDPFGLRYIALLGLVVALAFGSVWRLGDLGDMAPGSAQAAVGPSWEGWVAPPPYTGLPTLYLGDITGEVLTAPRGSEVTLRFYGPEGRLELAETVSGRVGDLPPASAAAQDFIIAQEGRLAVEGPGGREWRVAMLPDRAPVVTVDGPGEADVEGQMTLPFSATDDYGVVSGEAVITLDLAAVDRRYGLALAPEPREVIRVPLPMPISGSRAEFSEALVENFSQHPWANMPVTVSLTVEDAAAQSGHSDGYAMLLDARRFFDPLAAALIEMRRDLLWNRDNAARVAQVLRAVRWQGDSLFPSETLELRLMRLVRKVETIARFRPMTDAQLADVTAALWDMAVEIEEGDLEDARARMERARDRLEEAMRNGASDEEIARLMQELRDATQDYMRQLAQQQARERANDPNQPPMDMENAMRMTQDDIQRMMDRIQELMEEGRMAEAQQALEELQQMLENMQMTQGESGGEGQQSPGEQAMEGLGETLRDQQELSDEAFRDLQDQFNPDGNSGQRGQQGQQDGQQQGQQQQGGQGQQQGQQPGQSQGGGGGQTEGQQQGQAGQQGNPDAGELSERQRQLRQELERQRGNLPGAGTEAGRAARDALDRAGEAMRGAEEALGAGDLAEAIDQQSQAMDALREGMRNLGEAMSQQQREQAGQQGEAEGDNPGQRNDPLGRNAGTNGALGNDREMLQDPDVQRRARDLLDEIRRRQGEAERSDEERDYLRRLLDRF
ncbi:TIGR02302 family protein [Pseudooceanicola sp. 200-1SW]